MATRHDRDWANHLNGLQMKALGCDVVLTLDKAASKAVTRRIVLIQRPSAINYTAL